MVIVYSGEGVPVWMRRYFRSFGSSILLFSFVFLFYYFLIVTYVVITIEPRYLIAIGVAVLAVVIMIVLRHTERLRPVLERIRRLGAE